jgi:hypothetical protein
LSGGQQADVPFTKTQNTIARYISLCGRRGGRTLRRPPRASRPQPSESAGAARRRRHDLPQPPARAVAVLRQGARVGVSRYTVRAGQRHGGERAACRRARAARVRTVICSDSMIRLLPVYSRRAGSSVRTVVCFGGRGARVRVSSTIIRTCPRDRIGWPL